jgi:hypothetical protein
MVDHSAGQLLRWSRAVLLGAVAMVAGVLGHLSADGLLPGPWALTVVLAVCIAGSAVFLGRPASRLRVVSLLVGGQTFVHGTLTALAGHRGDPPLRHALPPDPAVPVPHTSVTRVGSLADQYYAGHPASKHVSLTVPFPVQHLVADMTQQHAVMALAHLLAAVAVGLWLARGERALWALLALTAGLATQLLEPALARWSVVAAAVHLEAVSLVRLLRQPAGGGPEPARPVARGLARSVVRRGPPGTFAA